MKKIGLFLVVIALLLATTTPALAAGKQTKFTLVGEITALSAARQTITVEVAHGNKLVQPYIGTQLLVAVTAETRLVSNDGVSTTVITFNDLKVGDKVSIQGVYSTTWTATRITQDLKPCKK